jgi:hypothetical protein
METAASLKQERDKPRSMTAQNDEPTLFQVHPSVSALVPGLLLHPGFERGQVSRRLLHWRRVLGQGSFSFLRRNRCWSFFKFPAIVDPREW